MIPILSVLVLLTVGPYRLSPHKGHTRSIGVLYNNIIKQRYIIYISLSFSFKRLRNYAVYTFSVGCAGNGGSGEL